MTDDNREEIGGCIRVPLGREVAFPLCARCLSTICTLGTTILNYYYMVVTKSFHLKPTSLY